MAEDDPFPTGDLIPIRGDAVRGLRRAGGLSQQELARLAGLEQTYLSKVERGGIKAVAPARLRALAAALAVDPIALRGLPPRPPDHAARAEREAADERLVARVAHAVAERVAASVAARVAPEVALVVRAALAEQRAAVEGDVIVKSDKNYLGAHRAPARERPSERVA